MNIFSIRNEGFPAQDVWFLGTLDQGSAQVPELLGNRRRRRHRPLSREHLPPPDPHKELLVGWLACSLVYWLAC